MATWISIQPSAQRRVKTQLDVAALQNVIRMAGNVIASDPKSAYPYVIRATAILNLPNPNAMAALQDLNKAITLEPDNKYAFYERGRANKMLGREQETVKDWHKAAVQQKSYFAAYALGDYYFEHRDFQQSQKWFALASKLKPDEPDAYFRAGMNYECLTDHASAVEAYSKAIWLCIKSHSPEAKALLPVVYRSRADAYLNLEKYDQSIADCSASLALEAYAGTYRRRARTYAITGNYKKAIDDFTVFIKLSPQDAQPALIERAAQYRKLSLTDAAIKDCTEAIKLNSRECEPFQLRGECYADKKNFSAAIFDMDEAIRRERVGTTALTKKAKIQEMMADTIGAAKTRAQIKDLEDDLRPAKNLGN